MKPIEPNCICELTHPSTKGWMVQVIERPQQEGCYPDGVAYSTVDAPSALWVIRSLAAPFTSIPQNKKWRAKSSWYGHVNEKWLRRIDDHEPEPLAQETEEEVTA